MLKYRCTLIGVFIVSSMFCYNNKADQAFFSQGNLAYEQGDYQTAKNSYLQLTKSGLYSKELYLNLGNTYFKLDSLAHAILFYEKGLKIAPGDQNLIHNLKLCNKIIKDKSSVKESVHITDWLHVFLGKSTNYWAYTSIFLVFISFSLLALFLFSTSELLKKATFYTALAAFIFTLFTIYFAWLSNHKTQETNYCILFSAHVWIKAEPSTNSESNFKLHEGSKMKIIDENENWLEISFDEKIGWVEKKDVQRI